MSDQQCGSVHTVPIGTIAGRCADLLMSYARPRAVTLDPEGRVWVESVATAAECYLVGVYGRALTRRELTRRIAEDLRHEKQARGLVRQGRRCVVNARRAA